MCSKSLRGMAIVKLYKNIKISEASAAPENRFLMRCTVSGVHLTGGIDFYDMKTQREKRVENDNGNPNF